VIVGIGAVLYLAGVFGRSVLDGGVEPLGYLIADKLRDEATREFSLKRSGGRREEKYLRPGVAGRKLLRIDMRVPFKRFASAREVAEKVQGPPARRGGAKSPADIRFLVAKSFRLVLSEGEPVNAKLASFRGRGLPYYTPVCVFQIDHDGHGGPTESEIEVAIVWELEQSQCRPPFKVRFGSYFPVAVPETLVPE